MNFVIDPKPTQIQQKLAEINSYHPFLKFMIEEENEQFALPFLDMLIYRLGVLLYSTWFNKPTDTGLVMNYHALAPRMYKLWWLDSNSPGVQQGYIFWPKTLIYAPPPFWDPYLCPIFATFFRDISTQCFSINHITNQFCYYFGPNHDYYIKKGNFK